MSKKVKRRVTTPNRRRKSSFDIKKIVIYVVALAIILTIYAYLSKVEQTEPSAQNRQEREEPEFRKDGELGFYREDGSVIRVIDIEIAEDSRSVMQGLMYRSSMDENQGMLFIFPRTEPISMWMRNTYIPLDMIFVREDKTISEIASDTIPFSEETIVSEESVRYVIEVNAGFSKANGIEPGHRVDW